MTRGAAAAAWLVLAAAAGAPAPAAAAPAGGIRRTREFQEGVDRAIERGVEALRGLQQADGSFGDAGVTALATYTLAACVDDPGDADLVRAFQRLRESFRGAGGGTYFVSLVLLALDARHTGVTGGRNLPLDRKTRAWAEELAAWLVRAQSPGGGFHYASPNAGGTFDNSNSQYALLGLKSARRLGLEVPASVWRKGLEHFLREQERDGPAVPRVETAGVDEEGYGLGKRVSGRDRARGWGYTSPAAPTGSMTSGGVSSLAICRSERVGSRGYDPREDKAAVQAIRDGLAWLGRHFTVEGNPFPARGAAAGVNPAWHYYYLYGLERAGVLAGVSWMGEHDWYLEGAEFLCARQAGDGTWSGQPGAGRRRGGGPRGDARGDLIDTCFALLFLKKATFRDRRGAVATEEDDAELDLRGAAQLDEATFEAVFLAVFGRYRRAGADRRPALAADFLSLGPRALGLLILRLDDDADAVRGAAIDALERITGERRGYRPEDAGPERSAAVAAWEEWYAPRRDRLAADAKAGRFVER